MENKLTVKLDKEMGRLRVYTKDGQPLMGEVFVRVTDGVDEPPFAVIKCFIDYQTKEDGESSVVHNCD